ncbi:MAG: cytochrome c oxidase subunit 3 [Bacteroidetes bacterium]|nr:cytochrome c oxidase subunit 3 [Bacteroidota bacterium]MBS1648930.1 cytochrome c oxidase subunit 3 [Bacteroidota bacterium]
MTAVRSNQPKKLHPHKFALWVAMGSICMMFAALTSAYVVKRNQGIWEDVSFPKMFYYSTAVIIISSITMHLALTSFKARERKRYKLLITLTALLGVLFALLQWIGFKELTNSGIKLLGAGSNAAASFLVVIIGLHTLHVLGGVIALIVAFFRAFSKKIINYDTAPIEIVATYWHFVDLLWIYLFIFLAWIK